MKKRKDLLEKIGTKTIFTDKTRKISIEGNKWFFEIGKELTTDIAEAVSLLVRECDSNDQIWEVEIKDINTEDITPEKSLYWLSGGYKEWKSLENYNRPWCDCYLDFQEEFGFAILNSVNRSKTLGDVREYFIENLNLPVLYDFALSKDLVR
jgi:hypothetical protein